MTCKSSVRSLISRLSVVGVMIGVSLSCSNAEKSAQRDAAAQKISTTKDISGVQVTFVELGSVNCVPCRMMQPVMKEIETAYAGKVKVVFIDVQTDQGRPYINQYSLQAIPTQVFLDAQGKEFARHIGFYPKDSIAAMLSSKGL